MLNAGSLKRFALAILKITCAISLAALILTVAVWGVAAYHEKSEKAANAPLAIVKSWREVKVDALGNTSFRLRTIWRNGNIYYQFDVEGYPPPIDQPAEPLAQAVFFIDFLDKDGFRLFEHRLTLTEMSRDVDKDGQPSGMSWKGDEFLSVDLYRRADNWELHWSGLPAIPRAKSGTRSTTSIPTRAPIAAAKPKWRDISLWRRLGHGMSKAEVQRILGEPGKISDLGLLSTWYYGYPLGGEATFDSQGALLSWSEP